MRPALGSTSGAYVAAFTAVFGWASLYPVAKPALDEVTPLAVALARASIAAVVLGCLTLVFSGSVRRGVALLVREATTDWRAVAVFGVLSFTGTSLIAMSAQRLLPASVNGVLNNLSPLWLAVYATMLGRARNGALLIAGTGLAAAGVALILLGEGAPADVLSVESLRTGGASAGVALSLLGSMLIAVSLVITRRLMRYRDPLALTAIGAAWGALPLLALVLVGAGGTLGEYVSASGETRLRLIWLGIGSTALNFALWSFALKRLPVTRVAPIQYLIVPAGVALAVLFLGEPLGAGLAAGTTAILAGLVLAQRGAEQV